MVWMVRWLVRAGVFLLSAIQLAGFGQDFHPVFDSIAHFRLQLSLGLMLGVILLLLFRSWRMAGLGGAVLLASFAMMPQLFGTNAIAGRPDVTLLQFNTRFNNPTPLAILPQLAAANPDVVTLEEVTSGNAVIMDQLKPQLPSQLLCKFASVGGTAVLSRWPILDKGCASGLAWITVDIAGRKATFASLHLHWPFPQRQPEQISALEPVLRGLPQPVILGGDFNAAPWSHAVSRLATASHTHVAPGVRLSWTIGRRKLGRLPFLPIDHVLLPEGASAEVTTGELAGSDHLPILARIKLP